jgi:hypothetical protein
MQRGELFAQWFGGGIRVEAQARVGSRLDCGKDTRGRWVRVFVGVEFNEAFDFRLFTRDVRVETAEVWPEESLGFVS